MLKLAIPILTLTLLMACSGTAPTRTPEPTLLPPPPAAAAAADLPTYTPYPTNTPWPTYTLRPPTPTPRPTEPHDHEFRLVCQDGATSSEWQPAPPPGPAIFELENPCPDYPTPEPLPTHTPYPTPTPYSTGTPYPTYTPAPPPTPLVLTPTPLPLPTATPTPPPTPLAPGWVISNVIVGKQCPYNAEVHVFTAGRQKGQPLAVYIRYRPFNDEGAGNWITLPRLTAAADTAAAIIGWLTPGSKHELQASYRNDFTPSISQEFSTPGLGEGCW